MSFEDQRIVHPTDSNIFWLALFISPAVWVLIAITTVRRPLGARAACHAPDAPTRAHASTLTLTRAHARPRAPTRARLGRLP